MIMTMLEKSDIAPIRILPDTVANKIAAGEVVERPASVVKELLENALDAGATRIIVRLVAAGRRLIEVQDNGHGMSEENALLAVERHATSKIREAQDLDSILSLGFRGEALASISAVSRFLLITRREGDESATQLRIDGGILREVCRTGAPVGTRISVARLYFNTPVRAKFLKGITTELNHCIDVVQRHAFACAGVGFQLFHNERLLLDVPEHASLRDRTALIWGLSFVQHMVDLTGEQDGFSFHGLIGSPELNRASRSHQLFYVNRRPVSNPSMLYGFQRAYQGLLTVGRHPVGIVLVDMNPRLVDVNIHPAKREIRFRDEKLAHDALQQVVRTCLEKYQKQESSAGKSFVKEPFPDRESLKESRAFEVSTESEKERADFAPELPSLRKEPPAPHRSEDSEAYPSGVHAEPFCAPPEAEAASPDDVPDAVIPLVVPEPAVPATGLETPRQEEFESLVPQGYFEAIEQLGDAPMQLFDTYLLVPEDKRLLIIDQHALHERLNYDALLEQLAKPEPPLQQIAVPVVFQVTPAQVPLLETYRSVFASIGIEVEPFGETTFQIGAVCPLYEESKVPDVLFALLDHLGRQTLFDPESVRNELLRTASRACKASIKAGDRLSIEERRSLLAGFRKLRPPYTCPHGRPIIVELTRYQMERSFRRIQ
jgi:DNA mismatch repair protein MutL